ncbi:MAG: ATP-binding protein [Candidatus Bathyarchaeia archaeon]
MGENMDWMEEIVLKRSCAYSTVSLIKTFDLKRIEQFINFIKNPECPMVEKGVPIEKYLYDVQLNKLYRISLQGEEEVPLDPMVPPLDHIDGLLREGAIVVIKYLLTKEQGLALSNHLFAWSQSIRLFTKYSSVVVFGAPAVIDELPEALKRIVIIVEIVPSTPEERNEILKTLAKEIQEKFKKRLALDPAIVSASAGLSLHDVETAGLESFKRYGAFKIEEFTKYKVDILQQYGIQYVEPERGFESVGGYALLKKYVQKRIIELIRNPAEAERYGLRPPRGIILYGIPGVGKTYFARAMAKEVGIPMLKLDPSTFFRGIVGESEARVKQVAKLLEGLAPVMVFVDEIDQIAMARESVMSTDSGVNRRITNMLLDWLGDENRRAFIVGATNFINQIDRAFLRPGRIDEIIPILPPDEEARLQILQVHTSVVRKVPLSDPDFLQSVAKRTPMRTGAELEELVIEAAHLARESGAEAVGPEHFERALSIKTLNITERQKQIRASIAAMEGLEIVNKAFLRESLKALESADGTRISALSP